MRLLAIAIGTALLIAACGGAAQPSPTAAPPTAAPAAANKVVFNADLKPENEVPPVPNEEKSGTGKAIVTFDLTRDSAGKVTAAKASFDITLTGFPTTTAIILAHIHEAAAGTNGNPIVGIKTDSANAITLTTGGTSLKQADVTVDAAVAQKILDNPAGYYVNVHSKVNGGGVCRGQLTKM
jgi:hypothetical protein